MNTVHRIRHSSNYRAVAAWARFWRRELWFVGYLLAVIILTRIAVEFIPEGREKTVAATVLILAAVFTVIQVGVELRLWYVQAGQFNRTHVGTMLRMKFFALAWRNADSLMVNVILGVALLWSIRLFNYPVRMQIYALALATILAVNIIGIRLDKALRSENDGQPDDEDVNIRQDAREVEQNAREVHQDARDRDR